MKLWMSGRIDHDIDGEYFRRLIKEVRDAVNTVIENKNYGNAIESWDVVWVIYKENSEAYFKYSARDRETDIEIPVNHDQFKKGDLKLGKTIFFDGLILSLQKLQEHKKIRDFDFATVIQDVREVAAREISLTQQL